MLTYKGIYIFLQLTVFFRLLASSLSTALTGHKNTDCGLVDYDAMTNETISCRK
jgi:hypothetical protein